MKRQKNPTRQPAAPSPAGDPSQDDTARMLREKMRTLQTVHFLIFLALAAAVLLA